MTTAPHYDHMTDSHTHTHLHRYRTIRQQRQKQDNNTNLRVQSESGENVFWFNSDNRTTCVLSHTTLW